MPDMLQMLTSGDFSDLIIKCRGQERRVHRVIVCGQSSVFKTMYSGPFVVRGSKLSHKATADLGNVGSLQWGGGLVGP